MRICSSLTLHAAACLLKINSSNIFSSVVQFKWPGISQTVDKKPSWHQVTSWDADHRIRTLLSVCLHTCVCVCACSQQSSQITTYGSCFSSSGAELTLISWRMLSSICVWVWNWCGYCTLVHLTCVPPKEQNEMLTHGFLSSPLRSYWFQKCSKGNS